MDKIQLLRERREMLKGAGKEVRAQIAALVDEDSFVELAAFTFSKDALFSEEAQGEGVVTGFATIGGYPFYLVAQNFNAFQGGLSKANCEKIAKALNAAEKSGTPVVYLLQSHGVRVGEGVNVLEGVAELLLKATQLKGSVLQFAILGGEVYGSSAVLASLADVVLFTEGAVLSLPSPFVLSAKAGKNMKPAEVGGYGAMAKANLPAIAVKDLGEAASKILAISDIVRLAEVEAELNEPAPALNASVTAEELEKLLENAVELGANAYPEMKTYLARVCGIATCAVVMNGVRVNEGNLKKLKAFAEFACCYGLPFVTFVDCLGVDATLEVASSAVLKEMGEYLNVLDAMDTAKIAVVTGKAIGLGYSLFAAKSVGFDYTFALATAQIALFESEAGAEIEFSGADRAKLAERYAEENADPFNAAKGGYLDDIVEPQFVKQYLIAALQTVK
ncbi:MAG: hypothetical protein IKD43_05380 [Clostridia bacterium]|nr:hypothetical protein [Clostridia bacterium]